MNKKDEKHKRYLYFEYSDYYPRGGLSDLAETFDDEKDAIEFAKKSDCSYKEVYDRIEGKIVYEEF